MIEDQPKGHAIPKRKWKRKTLSPDPMKENYVIDRHRKERDNWFDGWCPVLWPIEPSLLFFTEAIVNVFFHNFPSLSFLFLISSLGSCLRSKIGNEISRQLQDEINEKRKWRKIHLSFLFLFNHSWWPVDGPLLRKPSKACHQLIAIKIIWLKEIRRQMVSL